MITQSPCDGAFSRKAQDFEDLRQLDIQEDAEAGVGLFFGTAHRLALQYRRSEYDAIYLELASRQGLPMASLDGDLNKAAHKAGVNLFNNQGGKRPS